MISTQSSNHSQSSITLSNNTHVGSMQRLATFYATLFPSHSIHFFHSSFSLQWLSQVPKSWSEAKMSDDDKENIYVMSMSPASYGEQFKQDFKLFLRSRSNELVPEGGMLLTFMGRFDTSENISVPGLIRTTLKDMVSENLIEGASLEHFSVPNYFATADEVREIIEEEGSLNVERLESIITNWDGSSLDEEENKRFKNDNERAEFIIRNKRSVFEPLLKAHFGEGIMDELFLRFKNKVVQFLPKLEYPILVISLTKIA
ncbi:jasmonate O-methyltransferase-like isoform X1 [Prosopis cineraria]|uniref:jasmonate O-methyltransferase-like isoform X1 n=1 Tax=Prosopis cineraria TaxID=364024 RepID=UPI00240F4671|nr:jasmonate O-methyltransferase-like isoform X1 [Prosopis cineraria]